MARIVVLEQLIIGGILKLEGLDAVDVCLLKKWLLEFYDVEVKGTALFFTKDFIEEKNGAFSLKEGINLNTNVSLNGGSFPLKKRFSFEQGPIVEECLASLDLYNFVLRKIKYLGSFSKVYFPSSFTKKELKIIKDLDRCGYITIWLDDKPASYQIFEELRLTKLGEARLFIEDYKAQIEAFKEQLKAFGYNLELLEIFLSKSDLTLPTEVLLTKEAFDTFCDKYDLSPCPEPKKEVVTYISLPRDFVKQENNLVKKILTISNGSEIYIAHPNCLFNPKLDLTGDKLEDVCWESIDFNAMTKYYGYKHYNAKNSKSAIYCVHDLLVSGYRNGKPNHLVILEGHLEDDDYKVLVRGIIRLNQDGYAIALNPEFKQAIEAPEIPETTDPKALIYEAK